MSAPSPTSAGYRPLPGPVDRVSFFKEQSRNRRASGLLFVFAFAAIIVTGVPLGIIAAPLVYVSIMPFGFVMTALRPHSGWALLLMMPAAIPWLLFGLALQPSHVTFTDPSGTHIPHGIWPLLIATFVLAVVPGALLFLVLWRVVRIVLRRGGAEAILLRLGTRPPNLQDEEERQLVDVVQEIAVAAGISAPRVAIIDAAAAGGAANAAAVGWSVDDATVVVTRPLLDQLTRDQTQAVVARVVASIGNGDLKMAFLMMSIFEAVRVVQFAAFGVSRWRTLRVLWRCIRRSPSDTTVAVDLLAVGDYRVGLDVALRQHFSGLGCLLAPLLFPFRLSGWTIGFIISASEYLVTGPLVDATWRRRELLADATAVRLTRNPDGLAGALERIREIGAIVPKADVMSFLFAAWWPAPSDQANQPIALFGRRTHATVERRVAQLVVMGAHPEPAARPDVTPPHVFASPPAVALDQSPFRFALVGLVAIAFANVAGVMMYLALLLTSIELCVLAFGGLWLAQRLGGH